MKGKILDLNETNAFISLNDNSTIDVPLSRIPINAKVGDMVDIPFSTLNSLNNNIFTHDTLSNDKLIDFF
jgi:hypothetical protein